MSRRPRRLVGPTPLEAFGSALVAGGWGVKGTTLFEGTDTDIPSGTLTSPALISILDSGAGEQDDITHDGQIVGHPRFQVTVRHAKFATANALCADLHHWCSVQRDVTLGGKFWLWLMPVQRPFGRGKDAQGRPLISFNVRTAMRD